MLLKRDESIKVPFTPSVDAKLETYFNIEARQSLVEKEAQEWIKSHDDSFA